jgi:hypothetical protein
VLFKQRAMSLKLRQSVVGQKCAVLVQNPRMRAKQPGMLLKLRQQRVS